jgi:hypothetical protein
LLAVAGFAVPQSAHAWQIFLPKQVLTVEPKLEPNKTVNWQMTLTGYQHLKIQYTGWIKISGGGWGYHLVKSGTTYKFDLKRGQKKALDFCGKVPDLAPGRYMVLYGGTMKYQYQDKDGNWRQGKTHETPWNNQYSTRIVTIK